MKGYELIKQITDRKIKDNTKIEVRMGNEYKATLKYDGFMLKWQTGDFDTSILCSSEAEFEVIEENKEIERLPIYPAYAYKAQDISEDRLKINELVQAVNKLNKEREVKKDVNSFIYNIFSNDNNRI